MSIIRSPSKRRFTEIPNEVINDDRLTWQARGIFAYILSKPEGWRVNVKDLIDAGNLGRDGVYVALNSLVEAGYLKRTSPIPHSRPYQYEWLVIRERVFKRDNYTCRYCGAQDVVLECDHVFPVSRGGSHDDENLATSCKDCNRSKRDKTLEEWRHE